MLNRNFRQLVVIVLTCIFGLTLGNIAHLVNFIWNLILEYPTISKVFVGSALVFGLLAILYLIIKCQNSEVSPPESK
jgi:hypothetical protein